MDKTDDDAVKEIRAEESEPKDPSIIRETLLDTQPERAVASEGTSQPTENGSPLPRTTVSGPVKGKNDDCGLSNREPLCVIVEPSSTSLSEHSSTDLLIDTRKKRIYPKFRRKNNYIRVVLPDNVEEMPTTSKIHRNDFVPPHPPSRIYSESADERQMIDINLQSDNAIAVDDSNVDEKSVVMAYLRDQDALHAESALLATKKKSSLMKGVPKMETILESVASPAPSEEGSNIESGDKGSKAESGDNDDGREK